MIMRRIIVFGGLYWAPLINGNCHMSSMYCIAAFFQPDKSGHGCRVSLIGKGVFVSRSH